MTTPRSIKATSTNVKRTVGEAFDSSENEESNKRSKIDQAEKTRDAFALPKDAWGVILKFLHIYDTIYVRSVNSTLYQWCKEFRPFPKYFVLDQDLCMEYLVKNGFISLVEYSKDVLKYEWPLQLTAKTVKASGKFSQLKPKYRLGDAHFAAALFACSEGTCDLSMITYLHQTLFQPGRQLSKADKMFISAAEINMARHGHLSCLKYLHQHCFSQSVIGYTPSIECLDFAISNGYSWKEKVILTGLKNFCEVAASLGDLTMLKYAHQKGASLGDSGWLAAQEGKVECLKYVLENETNPKIPSVAKTLACFKYLQQTFGQKFQSNLGAEQVGYGDIETLKYMSEIGVTIGKPKDEELFFFVLLDCQTEEKLKSVLTMWEITELEGLYFAEDVIKYNRTEFMNLVIERDLLSIPEEAVEMTIQNAMSSQNIDWMKLVYDKLQDKSVIIEPEYRLHAAQYSSPEILEFLTQKGAKWGKVELAVACEYENLPNMAYLVHNGCYWSEEYWSWEKRKLTRNVCLRYGRKNQDPGELEQSTTMDTN